ncbi:MAG: ion channel-forming bestrophin family protein [Acidobacteriaceae bacterium]|jgi:putative membrane protein|nr:ion channel-forming bestrophin family protein [Acidobacteriaceae bacterium]
MIVRSKSNWWTLLFVWRGSMMKQMLPQLLIVAALSVLAVWTEGTIFRHKVPLNATPFTLVGVALALFLGFRNSSAYDRWWEGRKLWGALVNTMRTLTRQVLTMTGDAPKEARDKREFIDLLVAFTYAMRDQLRGDVFARSAELLPPTLAAEVDGARYKPFIILRGMGEWVSARYKEGAFGEITMTAIDRNLVELSNILGGCERIAATPVPFGYSVMIHRVVYFYCALLPFGLVDAIEWMTPAVAMVMAYSFIALDSLAAELEMPFGRDENGLALDAISLNIELSIREMSGEPLEKKPLQPVMYVLH